MALAHMCLVGLNLRSSALVFAVLLSTFTAFTTFWRSNVGPHNVVGGETLSLKVLAIVKTLC